MNFLNVQTKFLPLNISNENLLERSATIGSIQNLNQKRMYTRNNKKLYRHIFHGIHTEIPKLLFLNSCKNNRISLRKQLSLSLSIKYRKIQNANLLLSAVIDRILNNYYLITGRTASAIFFSSN